MSEIVTLRAEPDDDRVRQLTANGGTVAYRAYLGDRWVGWVGDQREWRGWRYGTRQWWACWREEGDEHARANVEHRRTRADALAWLAEEIPT